MNRFLNPPPVTMRPALRRSARAFSNSVQRPYAVVNTITEPEGPKVTTQLPGPQTQTIMKNLNKVFDTRSLKMIMDYKRSSGN